MNRHYDQVWMDGLYGFCHYWIVVGYDVFFRGDVAGLENVPKSGPFIIAANHESHLDPPLVGCHITRQMRFFARKTLWKPGLASWWLDGVGTIPVDRDGGSDVSAIKRVLQAIKENKVLIFFPEGTRSPDGNLQTAKPGVGLVACRTQVPVLPARIFGSRQAFGKDGPLRLNVPVSITYGKLLQPQDYDNPADGKERYQRASDRMMAAIAKLKKPQPAIV